MYNMEDILARLRNGEDADAIATELTNAMNSALEAHKAEVAIKAAEAAELEEEKLDYFVDLVDGIIDFIKTYYIKSDEMMEFVDEFTNDLDYRTLLDTIDRTVDDALKDPVFQLSTELLKRELKDSKAKAASPIMPKPIANTQARAVDNEEFDAIMKDFFKNFGIQ